MTMNHKEILKEVLCDVLEQMAFMFADPISPQDIPGVSENALSTTMHFDGPTTGQLSLSVPAAICPTIAENMLGVEPDDERVLEKAQDALKEVLNIACGNILTLVAGEEPVFDLTIPEVSEISPDEWQSFAADPDTVAFVVDDYPLLLRFQIAAGDGGEPND